VGNGTLRLRLAVYCFGSLWEPEASEEFLFSAVHAAEVAGVLRFAQDDRAYFLGLLFVIPRLDSHPHCKSGWGRSIVLAVAKLPCFPVQWAREWGSRLNRNSVLLGNARER
jgi:hypothetical protein